MTDLFAPERSREWRERAAYAKRHVSYDDVAKALALETGEDASCQHCGVIGEMDIGHDHFTCKACGARGDVIDLVRMVKGCGFVAACEFLENECGKACPGTGNLFSRGARGGRR